VLLGTLIAAAALATAPVHAMPQTLAARMTADDAALRQAPRRAEAVDLQRALRTLSGDRRLASATLPLLPPRLERESRAIVLALRDLHKLAAGWPPHKIRVGPAEPLSRLQAHYRVAQRRFRVGRHVLAAVNFVESQFGRLRNDSVSGAQGPMQFMPATWGAYGMGGDIHDPRDAILGAANLLHANGAPSSYARALFHYNPSPLYVDAVRRYARLIDRDRHALGFLYLWEVRR
jgi:membrane-bound lytic murein transglycosylase B